MITKIYYQNMFHKRTQISKFPLKSFFHFWCRENALYSAFILDFRFYTIYCAFIDKYNKTRKNLWHFPQFCISY